MSKKILIIEDDVETQRILSERLAKEGYEVTSAYDAAEGLKKIYNEALDLILCDIVLPKGGGLEICQKLKADEKLKNTPLVILTGAYTEDKDADLGLKLGADAYLYKPYELKELLDTIRRLA